MVIAPFEMIITPNHLSTRYPAKLCLHVPWLPEFYNPVFSLVGMRVEIVHEIDWNGLVIIDLTGEMKNGNEAVNVCPNVHQNIK